MSSDPQPAQEPGPAHRPLGLAGALWTRLDELESRVAALEIRTHSPAVTTSFRDRSMRPRPLEIPLSPVPSVPEPEPGGTPIGETEPAGHHVGLERTLGGRWYAVAGAVIVMIGIGLGLKFAYDQGWMRLITPAMRCLASGALGVVLIAAGARFRRAIGDHAAAALLSAGLGSLYGSAWAAYGLYQLVSDATAFALLATVAVAGILVAAGSGLVTIGVLAIIGGLLAPIVTGASNTPPWVMAAHLLGVMSVGSAVAAWKGGRFALLRSIAWWGVVLLGTSWAGNVGLWTTRPDVALLFPAAFFAIVHGGLWFELRERSGRSGESPLPGHRWWPTMVPEARLPVASIATTLWSAWMGVYAGSVSGLVEPWVVLLGYAAACLGLARTLRAWPEVLRAAPRTAREQLAAGLLAQAGGLVMGAIAFGLVGSAQTVVWLSLGLTAIAAGRLVRATPLDTYGLALLAVGITRHWTLGATEPALDPVPATISAAGLVFDERSGLWAFAAVVCLAGARLTQFRRAGRNLHALLAALFGTLALVAVPGPDSIGVASAAWAAAVAVGILLADGLLGAAARAPLMSTAAMAIAAASWGEACLLEWTDGTWGEALVHPGLATGLFIAAGSAALAIRHGQHRDAASRFALAVACLMGGATFLAGTSLEVSRVSAIVTADQTSRLAAVSIWWASLSLVLLAVGFARQWRSPRYAGLVLIGVAGVKALTVDLEGVSQGWRVVSVLGVGLMMLGVAVLYGKLAARLEGAGHADPAR